MPVTASGQIEIDGKQRAGANVNDLSGSKIAGVVAPRDQNPGGWRPAQDGDVLIIDGDGMAGCQREQNTLGGGKHLRVA